MFLHIEVETSLFFFFKEPKKKKNEKRRRRRRRKSLIEWFCEYVSILSPYPDIWVAITPLITFFLK